MSEHSVSTTGVDEERGHTFDGITEFDNRLPNWWLWSFYLACIFAVLYWFAFHVTGVAMLPHAKFALERAEQEAAEAAAAVVANVTDESLRALALDPSVVARGKKVWDTNCVACHKPDGGGLVGPNLTDKFWVHGGAPTQIYRTITKGVVEKGMLAWQPQLGIPRCQQVTAFLLTLRNTAAVDGKAPEGEPYDGN